MKINRNNYESFFIDYLEGNLDERLVDDFIEFLTNNPDLKEELAMFSPVAVEPADLEFGKKELLYKERFDLESEFDKAAVANLEGDLNPSEKAEFENYITNHPGKKHDLELFGKTRMIADESVVFQKKSKLYRTTTLKTIFYWSGRVAAVLAIALLVYFFADQNKKTNVENSSVAVIEDNKTSEKLTSATKIPDENEKLRQLATADETISLKPIGKTAKIPVNKAEENAHKNQESFEELVKAENEPVLFAQLSPVSATIEPELPETTLQTMYITIPQAESLEERFLVDVVKEKTAFEKINFNKVTKAGLNLLAGISKEKFSYQTDEAGKVTEIFYDSRLLAFTIPTTRIGENTGE